MIPKLTDDAVGRLPLEAGRAALLEEVLADSVAQPAIRRTPPRWVAPLAAAAVVAGLGTAPLWWPQPTPPPRDASAATPDQPVQPAAPVAAPEQREILLDAPGWEIQHLASDGLTYAKGTSQLEITSYPAESYASYVTDREHISQPPAPGEPIEVLGRPAQMWAYSAQDHTAIREVEDGEWIEVRVQGVDEDGFRSLLERLRQVPAAEFEATLPDDYTVEGTRLPDALTIIAGIADASGVGFPGGESPSLGGVGASDPYQFGVEVVGSYTCAWLGEYDRATARGDAAGAAEALRVLGTGRDWPVLEDLDAEGAYADVIRQIADEVRAGELQPWYGEGLGC